jgi:uncharacterized protein YukE
MALDHFFEALEAEFQDLTRGWWGVGAARLQEKVDRLDRALRERHAVLVRQRAIIEGLRHRLAESEARAARLAERVEVYLHVADRNNSWKDALELDHTRRTIARDREELRHHEQAYQDERAEVQRLLRRLAGLRERICLEQQG